MDAICEFATGLVKSPEVFVIGGSQLYKHMMPICDKIFITRILADVDGDTFFPQIDHSMWVADDLDPPVIQSDRDQYPMQFLTYRRRYAINKN
jgi:dihydrofolate reductase